MGEEQGIRFPYLVVNVGDTHFGNYYADIPSLFALLKKALEIYKPEELWIILCGDIIEGSNKYHTQIYKMFNIEPLRFQLVLLKWVISKIKEECEKVKTELKVRIVLGNHDLGYSYGNLLDLIDFNTDVRVFYDTYEIEWREKSIVYKHSLARGSRGSYVSGWTGYLLERAKQVLEEKKGDILITAHTHQPMISRIDKDGKSYIMLPPFLNEKEDYRKNYLLLFHAFGYDIIEGKRTPWMKLQEWNLRLMEDLLGRRRRIEEGEGV